MALILSGTKARDFYTEKLSKRVLMLKDKPTLAILQIGNIGQSNIYIEQKKKFGEKIGVDVLHIRFSENVSFEEVKNKINELNRNKNINGIILQLPTPLGFDSQSALNSIDAKKDVDGLTDIQKNLLVEGKDCFVPATAKGILSLLAFYHIPIEDQNIAVLGRSRLVGGPVAQVLKNQGAKVTVCHSKTLNTREITKKSNIIVVAIGKPYLIDPSYLRSGQVIIDVGMNTVIGTKLEEEILNKKIVGDVAYEAVLSKVSAITPVPGGVGPMTVLSLFENVVTSTEKK